MKKTYVAPESELTCFVADQTLATEWNTMLGKLYKAGTVDDPSAMDFTLPNNPEGDF